MNQDSVVIKHGLSIMVPEMDKPFERLKTPKSMKTLKLSETFIKDLILKIISSYGTVKTSTINELQYTLGFNGNIS